MVWRPLLLALCATMVFITGSPVFAILGVATAVYAAQHESRNVRRRTHGNNRPRY